MQDAVSVPTGVKNFSVTGIKIGHPTFGGVKFPSWFASTVNKYLLTAARDGVDSIVGSIVDGQSFGVC